MCICVCPCVYVCAVLRSKEHLQEVGSLHHTDQRDWLHVLTHWAISPDPYSSLIISPFLWFDRAGLHIKLGFYALLFYYRYGDTSMSTGVWCTGSCALLLGHLLHQVHSSSSSPLSHCFGLGISHPHPISPAVPLLILPIETRSSQWPLEVGGAGRYLLLLVHSRALPLWAELTGTIPSQTTLVGRR